MSTSRSKINHDSLWIEIAFESGLIFKYKINRGGSNISLIKAGSEKPTKEQFKKLYDFIESSVFNGRYGERIGQMADYFKSHTSLSAFVSHIEYLTK